MKNKEQSDLTYRYKQTLRKINHWLYSITLLKKDYWSPYDYRDRESFYLDHKIKLKECREMVNHLAKECKNIKNAILISNKIYNKNTD